jgi:hypothetical protein
MSPALSTLVVKRVIIHEIPKVKLGNKADSGPRLSEVPSDLTADLRRYIRERITDSIQTQHFVAAYRKPIALADPDDEDADPPPSKRPSPIPQLVLDYFKSNGKQFVDVSQDMARYLYDIQFGSASPGMLVLVDGTLGSGNNADRCLAILKLEMSGALTINPTKKDGKATFDVEVREITLKRDAKVFKAALYERTETLAKMKPKISDNQRDESKWGSEIASFFLRFLGCALQTTPERDTKGYLAFVDSFANSVEDEELRKRIIIASMADLSSNSSIIDPQQFAQTFLPPEVQDSFLDRIRQPDGSINTLRKDTALVSARLQRVTAEFTGDLKLSGPAGAMDEALQRNDDGNWEIRADLKHIGPGSRR